MKMLKKYKLTIFISSLATLLPMLVGAILWQKLPEQLPIHWGLNGNADAFANKGFVVFAMPLTLLGVQSVCLFATIIDKRYETQNRKLLKLFFWIVPAVSILIFSLIYLTIFNVPVNIPNCILGLLAVIFIIIGNYIPKSTQNRVLGLRIKWTMDDSENWGATHRFSGKIFVISGILSLGCIFIPLPVKFFVFFGIVLIVAVAPIIYSYIYHKKHNQP